jgi:hypothetical protein
MNLRQLKLKMQFPKSICQAEVNLCSPLCILSDSLCNKYLRTYTELHREVTELCRNIINLEIRVGSRMKQIRIGF